MRKMQHAMNKQSKDGGTPVQFLDPMGHSDAISRPNVPENSVFRPRNARDWPRFEPRKAC